MDHRLSPMPLIPSRDTVEQAGDQTGDAGQIDLHGRDRIFLSTKPLNTKKGR